MADAYAPPSAAVSGVCADGPSTPCSHVPWRGSVYTDRIPWVRPRTRGQCLVAVAELANQLGICIGFTRPEGSSPITLRVFLPRPTPAIRTSFMPPLPNVSLKKRSGPFRKRGAAPVGTGRHGASNVISAERIPGRLRFLLVQSRGNNPRPYQAARRGRLASLGPFVVIVYIRAEQTGLLYRPDRKLRSVTSLRLSKESFDMDFYGSLSDVQLPGDGLIW